MDPWMLDLVLSYLDAGMLGCLGALAAGLPFVCPVLPSRLTPDALETPWKALSFGEGGWADHP